LWKIKNELPNFKQDGNENTRQTILHRTMSYWILLTEVHIERVSAVILSIGPIKVESGGDRGVQLIDYANRNLY